MVFSPHVSFCWSLNVLTKFSVVKVWICTRGDHAAVSRRRFILITFLFVCFLVNRC